MSHSASRSYRLTVAGTKALKARKSVPDWYRSILCFVECELAVEAICKLMPAESREQALRWIDELDTLGFLANVLPQADQEPVIHRMVA
jgi:hypothetical protein